MLSDLTVPRNEDAAITTQKWLIKYGVGLASKTTTTN